MQEKKVSVFFTFHSDESAGTNARDPDKSSFTFDIRLHSPPHLHIKEVFLFLSASYSPESASGRAEMTIKIL